MAFPVVYSGVPDGFILTGQERQDILLKIRCKGFKLAGLQFGRIPTVKIDIANVRPYKGKGKYNSYLVTGPFIEPIANQLRIVDNIYKVLPDTLFFSLKRVVSKKVPVKLDLKLDCAKQHHIYGSVKYEPDSITITGPSDEIDEVSAVHTKPLNLKNISSSQYFAVPLEKDSRYKCLSYSSQTVKLMIPVEKYTEVTFTVPVTVKKNGQEFSVKIFPENVNITFMVALRDFKTIKPEMFKVNVRTSDISPFTKKLKVSVAEFPGIVNITRVDPEKVEFIIIK